METGIVKLTPELLAIFSGTENSNSLMPFTREIFLLDIVVAGTSFCENLAAVLPSLEKDTVLRWFATRRTNTMNTPSPFSSMKHALGGFRAT